MKGATHADQIPVTRAEMNPYVNIIKLLDEIKKNKISYVTL